MRVDKLTIITDVVTDERKEFITQTAATAYLREITGKKTSDSMLVKIKNTGRLLYDRYLIEGNKRTEKIYEPKKQPNHHLQKGKWLYEDFSFSNSVIVATQKRYKATEEQLNKIIEEWQSKILWIRVDCLNNDKRQRERNLWSVELYLKLDKDTPFLRKVDLMEKTIQTIGL